VSDVDRVERFRLIFRRRLRRDLLFQFRLQFLRRRVGIFSLFFLCGFFLLKVHVNFSSVFYGDNDRFAFIILFSC